MADTLPNISLPANTWVDLYSESGISVGTQINVELLSNNPINLTVKATKPSLSDGNSKSKADSRFYTNTTGDSGAWAYSPDTDSSVNVSEA